MKKHSLPLIARGLILVGVPLISQAVLIILLLVFLTQENKIAVAEEHSKDLIIDSHSFGLNLENAVKIGLLEEHSKDEMGFREKRKSQISQLALELNHIEQELATQPDQKQNLEDLIASWHKAKPAVLFAGRGNSYEFHGDTERMFGQVLHEVYDVHERIVDLELQKSKSAPAAREKWRSLINRSLLYAVVAVTLLAVVLAIYYGITIRQPIDHLSANAVRLSKRQELLPVLAGSDEFCKLDQLFHEVDEIVGEALLQERRLIDNAADMICSIDENEKLISVNPFSEKLLGYKNEGLIGRSYLELVYPADVARAQQMSSTCRQLKTSQYYELRLKCANGLIIDTLWSSFWSKEGTLFSVVHNITERKKIETYRRDLFAMISHDLKAPLTSVAGRINIVQMSYRSTMPEPAARELDKVGRNVQSLLALIDNLLSIEKENVVS